MIESGDYGRFRIPEAFIPLIEQSWNDDEKSLYGRFDLSWDGRGEPKMLEYNADTPTALLEASVVQWYWLQDVFPAHDQFNSIHERLIERWKQMRAGLPGRPASCTSPASRTSAEDQGNLDYLRDTAHAGRHRRAPDRHRRHRLGRQPLPSTWTSAPITALFKLYPWEWMVREEFGAAPARAARCA